MRKQPLLKRNCKTAKAEDLSDICGLVLVPVALRGNEKSHLQAIEFAYFATYFSQREQILQGFFT